MAIPTLSPLQLQPGRHDYRMGARGWTDGSLAGLWVAAASRPYWPTSGGGAHAGAGSSWRAAISANDRVYTADQDSNTVTVIDPKTTTVLGTIPLGKPRMDTNADVLGAMYDEQIGVHGLGFSRDGQYLNVIDVTTNAVHVIDTATNAVVHTIYVGRAQHEGIVKLLTWCGAARIGRLWRLRRGTRATGIRSRSSGTRCGCITVSR